MLHSSRFANIRDVANANVATRRVHCSPVLLLVGAYSYCTGFLHALDYCSWRSFNRWRIIITNILPITGWSRTSLNVQLAMLYHPTRVLSWITFVMRCANSALLLCAVLCFFFISCPSWVLFSQEERLLLWDLGLDPLRIWASFVRSPALRRPPF